MQFRSSGRRMALFAALALALVTVGTAATPAVRSAVAETELRFMGPFWTTTMSLDSLNGGQVGGETRTYLAGGTLLVGDVVSLTASNTVTKTTTAADHEKVVGVVVGGRSTGMRAKLDSADLGTTAAVVNRPVLVLRQGRTWVRMDTVTATDTLAPGRRVKPSVLNAGRVHGVTTFTVAADGMTRIFGTGVRLANRGQAGLIEVNAK